MLEGWGEMGIVLDIMGQQGITHGGDMEKAGIVVHNQRVVVGQVGIYSRHHYSQIEMLAVGRLDTN